MFVERAESRNAIVQVWRAEIFAILTISYAFICPIPFYIQVLITAAVTYAVILSEWSITTTNLALSHTKQASWMNALSLRFALDEVFRAAPFRDSFAIDWRSATKQAIDDVKSAQSEDEFKEKLGSGAAISYTIYVVVGLLSYVFRGLVGYGIASLVSTYAPNFAALLTTGRFG